MPATGVMASTTLSPVSQRVARPLAGQQFRCGLGQVIDGRLLLGAAPAPVRKARQHIAARRLPQQA